METLVTIFQQSITAIKLNAPFAFTIIALLAAILLINRLIFNNRLWIFGIYPRHISGLPGILLSGFLHRDFEHLFFNSIPLFILTNFILLKGYETFYIVTASIALLAGTLIWLFGRSRLHIGASHIIMGYFGYLLVDAYINHTPVGIALAVVIIYYFGGALLSVFPTDESVSWEGHLFGLLSGATVGYFYPLIAMAVYNMQYRGLI